MKPRARTPKNDDFAGLGVALATPMRGHGVLDLAALTRLVEYQVRGGVDFLVPCGTTGESVTLTAEEQRRVIAAVKRAAADTPVLAGAGGNDTRDVIARAKTAVSAGADGILSVGPYYNKPTQEGYYQHFAALAKAVRVPVVVYNVPGRTAGNILAETVLRLAEIPNIAGVKEASGDLAQIMQLIKHRPPGFLVLSGDDALTLPILALGGDGLISVAANEAPRAMQEIVSQALAGNWLDAREAHYRLLPLMQANFIESSPIPLKAALEMLGYGENVLRLPLVPASPKTRELLRRLLTDLRLLPRKKT